MKRDGQDRAIRFLLILNLVLLIVFLVLKIADVRVRPASAPDEAPEAVVSDAPVPRFTLGDTPEQILGAGSVPNRPQETTLPTEGDQQTASLISGSFAQRGGPDFSLYLDSRTFQLIENEGRCYFCPHDELGAKLYLELAFLPETDAQTVAASLLQDYGVMEETEEIGAAEFGGREAVRVQGQSVETQLDAYVIPIDGGCVTAVLCTPGGAEGPRTASLRASLETLELYEN